MTASAPEVTIGNQVTYAVSLSNAGPSTATGVTLTDPLFAGATFVSATTSQGTASYDGTTGTVTVSLGDLAALVVAQIQITVIPTVAGSTVNTATAQANETDANPGDNSASTTVDVVTPPGDFVFDQSTYTVNETAGSATITIDRVGGFQGVATVIFSTIPGGVGTPNVDYIPITEVVTFGQGETQKTVSVAVLENPHDNHDETVNLQLSNPTGGAGLGVQTTATLVIRDTDADVTGPTVSDVRLIGPANAVTGFVVIFSEGLNPSTATNKNNYTIIGPGGHAVPVGSVFYDPVTFTVLVTPAIPLKANTFYLLDLNGSRPGAITDLTGNPLNSLLNVTPGSDFASFYARGTKLTYADEHGSIVTMQIVGGGVLDLSRLLNGKANRLQVVGAVPHHTIITGSIKPRSTTTTIGSIIGLGKFGAIKTLLYTPPFYSNVPAFPTPASVNPPAVDVILPPAPKKTIHPRGPQIRSVHATAVAHMHS